ncbi:MAG: PDZ domain-containing protein, partial [Pirellulaceae bacterium]
MARFCGVTVGCMFVALATSVAFAQEKGPPAAERPLPPPGKVEPRLAPQDRAVAITRVLPGTPAQRAGLETGDIILSADDARVQSLSDLSQALEDSRGRVRLQVINRRSGNTVTVRVDLGPDKRLGIYGQTVSVPPDRPRQGDGILVTRVWPRTPAAQAGLEEGDIIIRVEGDRIDSLNDFVRALRRSSRGARLTVIDWRSGDQK